VCATTSSSSATSTMIVEDGRKLGAEEMPLLHKRAGYPLPGAPAVEE
jgi:hypothetical protein